MGRERGDRGSGQGQDSDRAEAPEVAPAAATLPAPEVAPAAEAVAPAAADLQAPPAEAEKAPGVGVQATTSEDDYDSYERDCDYQGKESSSSRESSGKSKSTTRGKSKKNRRVGDHRLRCSSNHRHRGQHHDHSRSRSNRGHRSRSPLVRRQHPGKRSSGKRFAKAPCQSTSARDQYRAKAPWRQGQGSSSSYSYYSGSSES